MPTPKDDAAAARLTARFHARPWVDVAPGFRSKTVEHETHVLRLVELSPPWAERAPCTKAHAGYVITGRFEVAVEGGPTVVLEAGDGIDLLGGAATPHRARALARGTIVFLVEPR